MDTLGDGYYAEGRRPSHTSKGGLAGLFRKKHRPESSLFEAAADDALDSPRLVARQESRSGGSSKWSLLPRRGSSTGKGGTGVAELQKDAEFFRSECLRLGQELQEVQYRLKGQEARGKEAQQRANLAFFKYELLVDLWAMRVLDNEELGQQAQGAGVATGDDS